MTRQQIQQIIRQQASLDKTTMPQLIETHISWVILTKHFAFKIKKPIKLDFLDFSTLEQRQFYCEKEIQLNQRFSEGIYQKVIPIRQLNNEVFIHAEEGEIIDYAVQMKRLDNSRRMDVLLEKDLVQLEELSQLAHQLAAIHSKSTIIHSPLDIQKMQENFMDILSIKDFLIEEFGEETGLHLKQAVGYARKFLKAHENRLQARHDLGFTIDGHGDLHASNVFLLERPVIFDGLEYSDYLRQVDVLNEVAFLCMDLEFYKKKDLSKHFFNAYQSEFPCILKREDRLIFHYYKWYRCNIRLKVAVIQAMQLTDKKVFEEKLQEIAHYLELFESYVTGLKLKA